MKLFHTADWHLGKIVQGVYMTEDQRYVLEQFMAAVEAERPDAVIISGDLYDRAVPPTEAVDLLDEVLERIVVDLETPVLAIAGNHDSPDRISFGTKMMESRGLYLAGEIGANNKAVVINDTFGAVHFHLIPYADPAQVRYVLGDDSIRTHDDAMRALVDRIEVGLDSKARHVLVGHAFVTPTGAPENNTSESERPLAIGGAEHVSATYFKSFQYTALGHLHQAHFVLNDTIRYAGSPLKYSLSEENHSKGFYIVDIDGDGSVVVEKRELKPQRDLRSIEVTLDDLEKQPINEDYVYVTLLSDHPVLYPMEKVRASYPNAMHVGRRNLTKSAEMEARNIAGTEVLQRRSETNPVQLFEAFYQEVKGLPLSDEKKLLFSEQLGTLLREEGGTQ
ncbi:exonuclease SbcCD subunit D [Paenibacillus sp. L3-i20]|uniref:exonuclease SbcCD subunit D n=1 Tax=Paenibacillus sp. L3-i20 TaxID=2905833 RepID=UPI001EDDFBAF|nr:exonuclease SbcCD subunit D [Paenibacillus sp. L3-i20]GKU80227.1 nuclease SbcCD subunit D [Paenibacillus sp. L3-i20]